MKKDKFCWLEWNFAKGPVQAIAWMSSLVPGTPPLLSSLTLMFAGLFLSIFNFAPLLSGGLPLLKYVFAEMPPALLMLTVSFADPLQQWNHCRPVWKCLCLARGSPYLVSQRPPCSPPASNTLPHKPIAKASQSKA